MLLSRKCLLMKKHFILLLFITFFIKYSSAQEFPKGFIMHLKLHNGAITNFKDAPDLYVGGLQLVPQYTVIEHRLRAGLIADAFYTNKKLQAAFGPTVSLLITQIKAGDFGSAANLHVKLDYLWGTNKQQLFGGGVVADLFNLITVGLTAHRDFNSKTWWLQNEVGVRISKKFRSKEL